LSPSLSMPLLCIPWPSSCSIIQSFASRKLLGNFSFWWARKEVLGLIGFLVVKI
jgi:hypothetical protein